MLNRVKLIAEKINEKLKDNYFLDNLFKHSQGRPFTKNISKKINSYIENASESNEQLIRCINFLLKISCEFNLLREVHELLELNIIKNIDQPIIFENLHTEKNEDTYSDNGKTLLGIAGFHGHIELVKYFIEVRLASVNAQDMYGNTSLHQVVYGDSYPFNNSNYGTSHDSVTNYLIQHDGDLSIKNSEQNTPYDCTKWCAPLSIENMTGRRFITNTGSALYYADKVRPAFEEELKKLDQVKNNPHMIIFKIGRTQAKDYDVFRLEHAIEAYVNSNKISYGYADLNQLFETLDNLSEQQWKHFRMVISSNKPEPYSFKYGPIWNQIPNITKKSALIGLLASIAIYHATHDILLSVTTGSLSAVFAWKILTEMACKNNLERRSVQEKRVNNLLQHDRFFKSRPSMREIQQLNEIQDELDQLGNNSNKVNLKLIFK